MESALLIHRLHFAFTITYHYLFPQLTMGLAPLIVLPAAVVGALVAMPFFRAKGRDLAAFLSSTA